MRMLVIIIKPIARHISFNCVLKIRSQDGHGVGLYVKCREAERVMRYESDKIIMYKAVIKRGWICNTNGFNFLVAVETYLRRINPVSKTLSGDIWWQNGVCTTILPCFLMKLPPRHSFSISYSAG